MTDSPPPTTSPPPPPASAAPPAPASPAGDVARCPRVHYLNPLQAGPLRDWAPRLATIRASGFTHLMLPPPLAGRDLRLLSDPDRAHPALQAGHDADAALAQIGSACTEAGLAWLLDLRLDAVTAEDRGSADPFAQPDPDAPLDPADPFPFARWAGDERGLVAFWTGLLDRWRHAGAAGFRWSGLAALPRAVVKSLTGAQRRTHGHALIVGVLDPLPSAELRLWGGVGLDRIEVSIDRWDEDADAVLTRAEAAAASAPLLVTVEPPFGRRLRARTASVEMWRSQACRLVTLAASMGDGWLMPDGFASGTALRLDPGRASAVPDLTPDPEVGTAIRAANGPMRPLGPPAPLPATVGVAGFVRRGREFLRVTVTNQGPPTSFDPCRLFPGYLGATSLLGVGEAASIELTAAPLLRLGRPPRERTAAERARSGRIAIEAISPAVDDGRFAVKRVVGDLVTVEADLICDGHDKLAAAVAWRPAGAPDWQSVPMQPVGNDRWRGQFRLDGIGRFVFRVQAWRDAFATYRDELAKKTAAGLDVRLEIAEGRLLVEEAAARDADVAAFLEALDGPTLLSEPLAAAMRAADARPSLTETAAYPIDADQPRARFSAWYEIFPRSMAGDGVRHGTFKDVVRQLPRIRDMGFDVLYFPPIHPIGRINRKGRNNTLTPGPDDPGSPYAIGSDAGGHDALHPELGTFDDFKYLREQAARHGLALALDFAIQCAPDHPWLQQHKDWFAWRPDGSLRYAENPPKKYEDIVNVDFYAPGAVPSLWQALADVVLFWMKQGVRIIRVDNPHTKPLPFWEWLLAEVKYAYPDAIFLAEAFTRPKVMNRLGKIGFTQSYTYFTWRNTRAELQDYVRQLTTTEEREFFRPNFFVNTPDINPPELQTGGRAAHLIRATLAATLASNWGVYCGFELCEATPVPGREEYLDSEKYQLRAWDWNRPGNIVPHITALNRIRRAHPALQSHLGVTFLGASDDQVLFYERATEDRSDVLLIAASLDPTATRDSAIELPLYKWGLPDQASLECRDLLHDTNFVLSGKWQRVRLSPDEPCTIWHARPPRGVPT